MARFEALTIGNALKMSLAFVIVLIDRLHDPAFDYNRPLPDVGRKSYEITHTEINTNNTGGIRSLPLPDLQFFRIDNLQAIANPLRDDADLVQLDIAQASPDL